jgi:hypothetical protein
MCSDVISHPTHSDKLLIQSMYVWKSVEIFQAIMDNAHNKPDRKDVSLASVMRSVSYVRFVLRSVEVLLPTRSNYRLGYVR